MSRLYRLIVFLLVLGSAGLTYRSARAVMDDPALTPLVERSADEIVAITDRLVAAEATPERLAALLDKRLAEDPRNWIALQAIAGLYTERGVALPARYQEAWEEDSGLLAQTGDCLACAWDIATCSLSTALLCKAPILLTPVEDLRGLTKAGVDYASGVEVDRLDLGLSVLGLSATALIVASGGTSATIKAGTALVRLARGMRLMSPRLQAQFGAAVTDGIRWVDLPAVRSIDDLPALVRTDAVAPVASILADLGRMRNTIGTTETLHLLPLIDNADDARALARTAEALGTRTVSRAELLGKTTLFRAALRVSDTAAAMLAGFIGLMTGIGALVANLIQTAAFRAFGRRKPVPPVSYRNRR